MPELIPNLSTNDLISALKDVGVEYGDLVYVASYMPILGPDPNINQKTVEALTNAIGQTGTIVMPTFNWDYCKTGIFNVTKTPSQVGVLTEFFRKQHGVFRSLTPPWCTFAIWGKNADKIATIRGISAFGPDGITQYLYDHNAKYILIGCPFDDAVIHIHWLEEQFEVPYRFWKRFIGTVESPTGINTNISYMYARYIDINVRIDSTPIVRDFENSKKVFSMHLGYGIIRSFYTRDYVAYIKPAIERDKLILLTNESRTNYLREFENGQKPKRNN